MSYKSKVFITICDYDYIYYDYTRIHTITFRLVPVVFAVAFGPFTSPWWFGVNSGSTVHLDTVLSCRPQTSSTFTPTVINLNVFHGKVVETITLTPGPE